MIRMAIQVVFIDDESDQRDVHEIARIDRDRLCPAALGLSLAEAKEITGGNKKSPQQAAGYWWKQSCERKAKK
jgi:hypothetical protein